ncbi:CynX/NimT family MFS transporter [Cytobacillus sp. FJAT-54145]|uniref:CynX/NimT family MFS transporter n=1 Tax=Cytobacillus spartinae TaxID=3299023 RepID=A0ABW6KA56_9BACI
MKNKNRNILLLIGIIFVAFNLRPSITSVGPVIRFIREDTGISNSLVGLLTTLPLVAFALLSPLAPKIAKKLGMERTVLVALFVLAIGIFIRSIDFLILLFVGTGLMGIGIAICNVLLPGIVKQNFPTKVGMMTGLYTVSLAICAGIAPGISVPLSQSLGMGWKASLGVWVFPVVVAIVIWIPQIIKKNSGRQKTRLTVTNGDSLWKSPLAWQVTLFMGLQSTVYFCFVAWLPEILSGHGISMTTAGWMVSLLQFSGLPVNILIPILADRLPNQRALAFWIGTVCCLGLLGILLGGNMIILTASIILIGASTGAALSLALTLIGLRSASSSQASDLSGMAQSIGYLLAALGPIVLGVLFDVLQSWTLPLVLLIVISIVMTMAGVGAGRNEFVLQKSESSNLPMT